MKSDLRDRAALQRGTFPRLASICTAETQPFTEHWQDGVLPTFVSGSLGYKEEWAGRSNRTLATRNLHTDAHRAPGRETLSALDVRGPRHFVTGAECLDVVARTGMARETLPFWDEPANLLGVLS